MQHTEKKTYLTTVLFLQEDDERLFLQADGQSNCSHRFLMMMVFPTIDSQCAFAPPFESLCHLDLCGLVHAGDSSLQGLSTGDFKINTQTAAQFLEFFAFKASEGKAMLALELYKALLGLVLLPLLKALICILGECLLGVRSWALECERWAWCYRHSQICAVRAGG